MHIWSGIIAAMLTSIVFVGLHHVVISPIWFILPFALLFGGLTGWGLAMSQSLFFQANSLLSSVKTIGLYFLPILILDLIIAVFVDPIFSMEEASNDANTGILLGVAFAIVIPYSLAYGLLQGLIIHPTRIGILTSMLTNTVILTGIGHNIPLFNLVETPTNKFWVHLFSLGLIALLSILYIVLFQIFLWTSKKSSNFSD